MFTSARTRRLVAIALPFFLAACGSDVAQDMAEGFEEGFEEAMAEGEARSTDAIVIADAGFSTPESVLHETGSDVYLVSNINGAPTATDGNGFISRVSPEGEVLDLKWIDGEAEGVTLNAPKGMAVTEGMLWVTDIDCVRRFELGTGEPAGEACIEGATFLNDLVPHPDGSGVLLTDSGLDETFSSTGADAVYHMTTEGYAAVIEDPDFGAPNGIAATPEGAVLVVTFMSGQVFNVTGMNEKEEILAVDGAQLDGIEVLDDGRILVSNWATSCVHLLDTEGNLTCAMPDLESPADIGFDAERGHVLVPLFNANEVRFIPLG
ncbi:MAG TPA: hypothetical protein VJ925_12500 [Longimicrobiales bacterium]|nr:hypothetical protein [Longimicrobiales bacterium]